jgi:hypothetical protein
MSGSIPYILLEKRQAVEDPSSKCGAAEYMYAMQSFLFPEYVHGVPDVGGPCSNFPISLEGFLTNVAPRPVIGLSVLFDPVTSS